MEAVNLNREVVTLDQLGVSIVVDSAGDQASTAVVVWLHSEWGTFDEPPLSEEVLSRARVLVVHQPGWGVSTGEERLFTLADVALAYWTVLDRLGVGSALLAGHGIGATVVAEMTVQQPARVRSALLVAPFGLWDDEVGGEDIFALMPKDALPHLYADVDSDLRMRHFPSTNDPHERGLAGIRRAQTLGPASRYLYPLPETGIRDRLYRMADVPVELIWGAEDGVVPLAMADQWLSLLPRAGKVVVPNAAHMVAYETDAVSTCCVRHLDAPG